MLKPHMSLFMEVRLAHEKVFSVLVCNMHRGLWAVSGHRFLAFLLSLFSRIFSFTFFPSNLISFSAPLSPHLCSTL